MIIQQPNVRKKRRQPLGATTPKFGRNFKLSLKPSAEEVEAGKREKASCPMISEIGSSQLSSRMDSEAQGVSLEVTTEEDDDFSEGAGSNGFPAGNLPRLNLHLDRQIANSMPRDISALVADRSSWAMTRAEADMYSEDPATKTARKEQRKAVFRTINRIAGTETAISATVGALLDLLTYAIILGSLEAVPYTIVLITERLVAEGELRVSRMPSTAFSVAAVIVRIIAHAPQHQSAKLRSAITACLSLKILDNENLALANLTAEEMNMRIEEDCGYVALQAAILQKTDVPYSHDSSPRMGSPFAPREAIAWLTTLLEGPQCDITPYRVLTFLRIAGYEMALSSGSEFESLMTAVSIKCLDGAWENERSSVLSPLTQFVQKYEGAGRQIVEIPEGKLLPVRDSENCIALAAEK